MTYIKGLKGREMSFKKLKGVSKEDFFSLKVYRVTFGIVNLNKKWEEIQSLKPKPKPKKEEPKPK